MVVAEVTRMSNNLTEYMSITSGVLDNVNTTCTVESMQVISKCNEYLFVVLIAGIAIGMVVCCIGALLGSWYHGRKSLNK